jgi:excisionase family DNA binding protein
MAMLKYLSTSEVAEKIGCSVNTVSRVAKARGLGVYASGRLVAIDPVDCQTLRAGVHPTSGNPDWIASKGKTLKKPKR